MIESRHTKYDLINAKNYINYTFFKKKLKINVILFSYDFPPFKKPLYGLLRFHELSLFYASVIGTWHILGWGKQANKQIKHNILRALAFILSLFCLWGTEQLQTVRGSVVVLDLLFVFIIHYWEFSGRVPRKSYFINYNLFLILREQFWGSLQMLFWSNSLVGVTHVILNSIYVITYLYSFP